MTVFCFFASDIILLAALFFFFQLLIISTGVGRKTYFSSQWLIARLGLMFILLWPFFDHAGEPVVLDLWIYKVTIPAFLSSLAVALRIFIIASGWFILMFTTKPSSLVRGLVKLGIPYDFGLSLSIALRYLPHFTSMIDQIKDAQVSRGFDMRKGGPIRRARNYIPVLIPTVAIALRTADVLSSVLVCRGYGAKTERTYLKDIRMRLLDKIAFAAIIVFIPAAIILDILGKVTL